MAPKGGTLFFLLIVICAAFAMRPDKMPGKRQNPKDMAKKLMKKCQSDGYPEPDVTELEAVFKESDVPSKSRNKDQPKTLSSFLNVFNSLVPAKGSNGRVHPDDVEETMMDRTKLSSIIKGMKSSREPSCYVKAFVGSFSWDALSEGDESNMGSDDYDTLLPAAKPVVVDMPLSEMNFPEKLKVQGMRKWIKMLKELYSRMSEEKRAKVLKWAKEQISNNYYNCTTMPKSDPKSEQFKRCDPSLKWLGSEALEALGPFLSDLKTRDVDSFPKEKLCEFFNSAKLKASMASVKKLSLAKRILEKVKECYPDEKKFEENADKLGKLACFYKPSQKLTPDLSRELLVELKECADAAGNRQLKKLRENLIDALTPNSDMPCALQEPDINIWFLSAKQLSLCPPADLKNALKKTGPDASWTPKQLRALFKKILGDKKCKEISCEELMDLGSAAKGLPRCVLKHVKTCDLKNTEGLNAVSKRMKRGQKKTMLQQLRVNADPSELLEKLPESLLQRVSLEFLEKENIPLEQLKNKMWSKAQASLLMKKKFGKKNFKFRKLGSLLQGITCKMISETSDEDLKEMVQDTAETAQWMPKILAGCAARELFANLEKVRPDYFKTITKEELEDISSVSLMHLPAEKVKDLPDRVCPVLLDKMENANLSSLPLHAPSRFAFTKRALLCLVDETDLSVLITDDVEKLGPFLCELSPSQLSSMEPEVLTYSLKEMALRCKNIPQRHRAELARLVIKTYGSISEWSDETIEDHGPLILLDDSVASSLTNSPSKPDVLNFLKLHLSALPATLKKTYFQLITSNTARRKRTVKNGSPSTVKEPTADKIEELQLMNVFWSAEQLDKISKETFDDTVETLGSVPDYNADQLTVLRKKSIEAFGPVPQMNETVIAQLGCITMGFSEKDLQTLPFSLDTLEEIAQCVWDEQKIKLVWRAAAMYNNLTAEQLGAAELVSLNRFICGLDSNEMKQINKEAFKEAVDSMNDLQCSFTCTQQLALLAKSAFGPPRDWTEAQVSTMGNLMAGLDAAEFASLDTSVLSFFSETSIPLIPPKNFAALSVDQLMALGPDNAAKVTKYQRAALTHDQLSAVNIAMEGTGPEERTSDQTSTSTESGAPSLTVEGILSVMKPFLFLLMGFLLL